MEGQKPDRKKVLAGLSFLILALVVLTQVPSLQANSPGSNTTEVTFVSKNQARTEVTAEIADTPEERTEGLMYRRSLEKDRGMLFIFPGEKQRSFWMKNTFIPLDIIFIDSNKTIINIEQAEPQPNASEENLKLYKSDRPAKYVLEVNQGFSKNNSIDRGDRVNWSLERNQ